MTDSLFSPVIDKVFVFLSSDDHVTFVLPWLNFDFIYITILVCITIAFIFDTVCIFLAHWRKH